MRKAKSTISRLLTVALALVMVLSLSVTAFAAGETKTPDAPPYQVDIYPTEHTDTGTAGRFNAYQIFDGDISGSYTSGTVTPSDPATTPDPIPDPGANELSDITWGSGVKADKINDLLDALGNSNVKLSDLGITTYTSLTEYGTVNGNTTLGDIFKKALENAGWTKGGSGWTNSDTTKMLKDSAAAIAKAISDLNDATDNKNNSALAQEFAKVLAAKTGSGYTYLNDEKKVTSTWNRTGKHWELGDKTKTGVADAELKGGYYLILDTEGTAKGDAQSEYMMTVVGNTSMYVKSDAPEVDKEIIPSTDANGAAGSGNAKADAAGVGDTVTYRLKGTLPENFGEYEEYKFTFHDTLSKGLTYKDIKQVYVKVPAENGQFGEDGSKYDVYIIDLNADTGYQVTPQTGNEHAHGDIHGDDADHTLYDISFKDLHTLQGKKITTTTLTSDGKYDTTGATTANPVPVTNKSEVYVEYNATVNDDAVLGSDGNENDVYLEYSNNPNDGGEGTNTTTDKKVYDYVFGLDIKKIGVGEVDEAGLDGAGFTLSKTVQTEGQNTTYYAVFTKEGNTYKVAGWVDSITGITYNKTGDNLGQITEGLQEAKFPTENGPYYIAFVTGTETAEKGKAFIEGLDEGNYTLTEVITPDGYNTMDPTNFEIEAVMGTVGTDHEGELTAVRYYPLDETGKRIKVETELAGTEYAGFEKNEQNEVYKEWTAESRAAASGVIKTGLIPIKLQNTKTLLPGTGGIGTIIFQVTGIVLLAGAAIYLFVSSRKRSNAR